jgi:SAM-dependent methyltransferase
MQTTAFTGTASYYARYRPPYPDAFLSDLRSRAGTSGRGTMLDLACGPGRVAIPMAPYFGRVLAVDIEPEMIAVGEQEARARGITNITWRVERAEELTLAPRSLELITIGEAFHRVDQDLILAHALRWLEPGGSLATLGGEPVWRGKEKWKRVLVDVVNRWTGQSLDPIVDAWGEPTASLCAAGLKVEDHVWAFEKMWTCDSIVGLMFSTSIASRRVLGDKADRFEADLRAALLDFEPSDRFVCMQRFGFTIGRKS